MADEQNNNTVPAAGSDEKEIDLLELASKLWQQRKKLLLWSVCGALVGLVVAFSIPKEYDTQVKLSPESGGSKISGGLSSLAAMAGFGGGGGGGADAVYPQLYPDVVSSVPFTTALFDVVVTTKEDGRKMTVAEYMEDEIRSPWWGKVMGLPGTVIGLLRGSQEEEADTGKINNFQLTPKETGLVGALNKRITATVDAKTNVVTIAVQMQDPLVSAVLADTVVARLQEYITDYRTTKSRKDLEYAEKINEEAKANYYAAQQRLASFLDRNQNLTYHAGQIERDRLENESSLAFNLYNATAQQVQQAQAKVQENTPAYAVVTPATVPVAPSSPRKILILAGFTFLAFVACAGWILFAAPLIAENKDKFMSRPAETDISKHKEN